MRKTTTTPGLRQAFEWGNYAFALVSVLAIGGATLRRRRQAQPMVLPARPAAGREGGGTGVDAKSGSPSAEGRS